MNSADRQILLDDGRRLGYAEYGDPAARPFFYFHGIPSSRLEAALCDGAARRRRIRLVAVDRPGYGLSDFQPRRKLADWPDDVLQLARALGFRRFAVVGVSAGAPYALACAWKIPQNLAGVKIVSGLGPVYRPEIRGAMPWHSRLAFGLARRSYVLLRLAFGDIPRRLVLAWPALAYGWQMLRAAPADREVLADRSVKAWLLESMVEGLRQGPQGVLWDLVLYAHDWGFPLEQISVPVELWHGEADAIVPPGHAEAVAGALRYGRVRLLPGEGHFSLPIRHSDAILNPD